MSRRPAWLALFVMVPLSLAGCAAEIGDSCVLSTDCSETGDRICDKTQPNGYCTIVNCEPDTCPGEAACIGFRQAPSTANVCESATELRTLRTFCMRKCSNDGDCRSGYECQDLGAEDNEYGALLTDRESSRSRVCIAPYVGEAAISQEEEVSSEYCTAGAYEDDGAYASGGQGAGGEGAGGAADPGTGGEGAGGAADPGEGGDGGGGAGDPGAGGAAGSA